MGPEVGFNEKRHASIVLIRDGLVSDTLGYYGVPAKAPDKMRKYPYEYCSSFIFEHEKSTSKQAGRPSRLRPFEVTPYNQKSNNCKVQALDILDGILSPDDIITITGWHRGIPLYSGGQLDWLFFKGEGSDWYEFKKKSGQTIFSRKPETSQIKWQPYVQEARSINLIEQLMLIERLIEAPDCADPQSDETLLSLRNDFLNLIRRHYECFAHVKNIGWSVLGLFSWEKTTLMGYRRDANHLLQMIYAAAVGEFDPYAINKNDPADLAFVVVRELPVEKKKMICEIMGRAYQQGFSSVTEYVEENPKMEMM